MINYVQKFAGGKVSIEVSDPDDISKLSTLYADDSEARVVNMNAGLYRLINGVWTYVPGSGGVDDKFPLIIVFSSETEYVQETTGVVDTPPKKIKQAIDNQIPILCYHRFQSGIQKALPVVSYHKSHKYVLSAEYYKVLDVSDPGESYEKVHDSWICDIDSLIPTITSRYLFTK